MSLDTLKKANANLRRTVLDNGLICLVKEDRTAPVVAVQIWVGSGAIHEEEWLGGGLSHFLEHMIFKGTPTRGGTEIARQLDDAGGEVNAYTAADRTVFYVRLPSKNWRVGVDVLSDAVMNASLPADEWAQEREVILREFAMGYDNPGTVLAHLTWDALYRTHPYRVPVIGYEDVFKTMTIDDLRAYFQRNYVPDNMIAVVVGDVKADEAQAYLKEAFKGFTRRRRAPVVLPNEPAQIAPRMVRKTGAYEVSRLEWCYHTVPVDHPDAPALEVLAMVVGGGRSARLVENVREKAGLAFSIGAFAYSPKQCGIFGISAEYDPAKEEKLLAAIQKEVDAWATRPFPAVDLERARRQAILTSLEGLRAMDGQASAFGSGEYYAADPHFTENYLEAMQAVTAARLREVVRRYLRPGNRTVAILSPESAPTQAAHADADAASRPRRLEVLNTPLIVRAENRLPVVNVVIAFRGGLLSENANNNGITALTAELLTRGTTQHSAADMARRIERLGASVAGFSGVGSLGLSMTCLSADVDKLMPLFTECLADPAFAKDEIRRQQEIQLAEIAQQREKPVWVAQDQLRRALFPGHPYSLDVNGSPETVQALTRKDLQSHARRLMVRSNAVIAVFGDVTEARAKSLAEACLKRLPAGPAPELALPAPRLTLPTRLEKREPRQQAVLFAGFPGVALGDMRQPALDVLREALSGMSSDLFLEVREKRGLVYFVSALNRSYDQGGLFALFAGTQEKSVPEILTLMRAELDRLGRDGLRPDEISRAREQLIARADALLQDDNALAQQCALAELTGLGFDYPLKAAERFGRLTNDELRRVAEELFKPERCAVSVVFPEQQPAAAPSP